MTIHGGLVTDDQTSTTSTEAPASTSLLAAKAALAAIGDALDAAQDETRASAGPSPERALASLALLRQLREQLAGWETGLIETAREAGASWAELAHPLGVASRQAAERRYLRGRPGFAGTTGEQRVQATRDLRAADRDAAAWARANAADLRRLAGQITAIDRLPPEARPAQAALRAALGAADVTELMVPLAGMRPYLDRDTRHAVLVESLKAVEDRRARADGG
ncbi:type III effector protein [Streptomyces xanthochromogenes]|uniref:type III effector protein n=1 Tax=Streptomyces xanthochromogenes TaxID=67384 RepID=UPI00343583BA